MSKQDNGGPAFPTFTEQYSYGYDKSRPVTVDPGMSLRDYFAAKASDKDIDEMLHKVKLVQRVVEVGESQKALKWLLPDDARQIARYMCADAMLKAREA